MNKKGCIMPEFFEELTQSDNPKDIFLTTPIKQIIPALNSLNSYLKTHDLCLKLLKGADEEGLVALSEHSLAIQKEFEHRHLKRFHFGQQLDIAIKTTHMALKLISQLDKPENAIEYYRELSKSDYLPYAPLLATHFSSIETDKLESLTETIAKKLSHSEYYHFNEFLRSSAPDSALCKTLQAQPYNISAYKSQAINKAESWHQYAQDRIQAAKDHLPSLSIFKCQAPTAPDEKEKSNTPGPTASK